MTSGENYDMASVHYTKALEIARKTRNVLWEARLINNLAEIARLRGDFRTAIAMYQNSRHTAQQIGNRNLEYVTTLNIGTATTCLGNPKETLGLLRELLPALHQSESQKLALSVFDLYRRGRNSIRPQYRRRIQRSRCIQTCSKYQFAYIFRYSLAFTWHNCSA